MTVHKFPRREFRRMWTAATGDLVPLGYESRGTLPAGGRGSNQTYAAAAESKNFSQAPAAGMRCHP